MTLWPLQKQVNGTYLLFEGQLYNSTNIFTLAVRLIAGVSTVTLAVTSPLRFDAGPITASELVSVAGDGAVLLVTGIPAVVVTVAHCLH